MSIFNVVIDGKTVKKVDASTETEAYAVADDLGFKGKVYDIVPETSLSAKPNAMPSDASWINTNFGPAQNPITESKDGTYNYEFSADGQSQGEHTFQTKPTDVQLKMFAREQGLPENVRWEQKPERFKQTKASVDASDNAIALFPRTAKSVGRGEGRFDQGVAGALDAASLPFRALGAGIDKLAEEDKGVYADVPSMYYTGGEVETPKGVIGRGNLGYLSNEILRDPTNALMMIPGLGEAKLAEKSPSMLRWLGKARMGKEVPMNSEFANMVGGLTKTEPTVLGKVAKGLEARPLFPKVLTKTTKVPHTNDTGWDIVTEPTKLGKAVKTYTTPALEGATVAGTELANAPTEDREASLFGAGLGAVLPTGLKALGKPMRKSAVASLISDIKPTGTAMKATYAPEFETLFKNNDIPWTGGTQGILDNVDARLARLNVDRTKYLTDLEKHAVKRVEDTFEPSYGENTFDVMAQLEGKTGNLGKIEQGAYDELDNLYLEGGIEKADVDQMKAIIKRKVDDLRGINPLPQRQETIRGNMQQMIQHGLPKFRDDAGNSMDEKVWAEAEAVLSGKKTLAEVSEDVQPEVEAVVTEFPQSKADFTDVMPLSKLSKRRSLWFNQGKINSPANKNMAPNEVDAASRLWTQASKELGKNPLYSQYSGEMAQYVPIENAMEQRMGAINNRKGMPFGLTELPLWALTEGLNSNLGLKARYALGSNLERPFSKTPLKPFVTTTGMEGAESADPTMDTEAENVPLFPNDRALLEALLRRQQKQ